MGCGSLGTLIVVGIIVWAIYRAVNPENQQAASWDDGTSDGTSWEVDGANVELKGDDAWQWANIKLTMPFHMPAGLIVGVRPSPRVALQDGAKDERAFYAIADALGKSPDAIVNWATPPVRAAILDAWWQLRQGFQLRGRTLAANIPVNGPQDQRIRGAIYILNIMAHELSTATKGQAPVPPAPVKKQKPKKQRTAKPKAKGAEKLPQAAAAVAAVAAVTTGAAARPEASPAEPSTAPATTPSAGRAPKPTPMPGAVAAPVASPMPGATRAPVASPMPSATRAPVASPMPGAATAPKPSPMPGASAAPSAAPMPQSAGPALMPSGRGPLAQPTASAPPTSLSAPTAAAPPAPARSPSPFATSSPATGGGAAPAAPSAEELLSSENAVAGLLEALQGFADQGGAAEGWLAENWLGKRISGQGKVNMVSTVYGTDSDFGVSGGVKVTFEVKLEQPTMMSPKVTVHLSNAPAAGQASFGKQLGFSGSVKGYHGLMRTLLLEDGSVEVDG